MNTLTAQIYAHDNSIPLGRYCIQVAGKFVFFSDSLTEVIHARTQWGLRCIHAGFVPNVHAYDTITGNEIISKN